MAEKANKPQVSRGKARIVTFVLLFAFALFFSAYDLLVTYPDTPHTGAGTTVLFTVKKGIGPKTLTKKLQHAGLITSPGKFGLWLKLTDQYTTVNAGEFRLTDTMTPSQIIDALQGKGAHKGIRITVPEGFTLSQIGALLDRFGVVPRDDFRKACFDATLLHQLGIPATSAEGFLFPDTYFFDPNTPANQVITRMHQQFIDKTAGLGLPDGTAQLAIVTLASIVQAEAKIAAEAPIIAGVYTNRMNPEKFPSGRLQADPTVAYGCDPFLPVTPPSCATFKGVLGSKQLTDNENLYNTYKHAGLPPGPICVPGLPAIAAALNPKPVPYFYFVVSKDGRHQFSTTLTEHEAAVRDYRKSSGQ
ncbi:MAG: endolytic transglycosylase MltG [Deltaproteobacteria bacterium]|nr:endolytic transglycosylase MltG [Deltaproteobacteria bacterium]MBN2672688.1 endolytic transglycosylase MltG [Deltaproteobacteria bacterium]